MKNKARLFLFLLSSVMLLGGCAASGDLKHTVKSTGETIGIHLNRSSGFSLKNAGNEVSVENTSGDAVLTFVWSSREGFGELFQEVKDADDVSITGETASYLSWFVIDEEEYDRLILLTDKTAVFIQGKAEKEVCDAAYSAVSFHTR